MMELASLADVTPAPRPGMWVLDVPWYELVARAVLVYLFLLVLLRLTGKRQVGQLAPFDLVLLLILSNAVQNAMNGGDNSFTAGALSAAVLVAVNGLVGYATFRSKWLEGLVEGTGVAEGEDEVGVLAARPVGEFSFEQADGEADVHRDLDAGAENLAVALVGVAVSQCEQRAWGEDG